jgi:hypothetical protein
MDKWYYMKLKSFSTTKEMVFHRVGENIHWLYFRQRTDNQKYKGRLKN